MTSTPVKEAGQLWNFVGSARTSSDTKTGTGTMDGFGDVMSRTSYGGNDFSFQSKVNASDVSQKTRVDQSVSRKDSLKTTETAAPRTTGTSSEQRSAVEEAGQELVRETAKELDVSEEEVLAAMEVLGLGMADLLNADNLTSLVMMLSGEESALAMLTDEALYGTMQNLLDCLNEVSDGLMEEFSMSPEEFDALLTDMTGAESVQTEDYADVLNQTGGAAQEETAKITVTVEQGNESIRMTTDENGNTEQIQEVVVREEKPKDEPSDEKGKDDSLNGSEKRGFAEANLLADTSLKNQVQDPEAFSEQQILSQNTDTADIMDQILDYMKIQLKPGVEQLEMQLHPESLGTVHIQLTSRAGEITAQFHVQNEAVRAALESQITELKESLREQGVKVEAVEVTVESHGFESNLWQGQERDDSASYQNSKKGPRRINLNALGEDFEEEADEDEKLTAEMMRVNGGTVDYTA